MEILAYIHSAQASEIDASQLDWQHHPRRFPPLINWVRILSIPLTFTMITNATNAFAFLRRGDSGPEVVQLQNQLKSLGYFQARSTGFFASHTLEVVTKFQADHGLPQDGIVGQQTQSAIDAVLGNRSSVPSSTNNAVNNLDSAIVGNLTPGTTGVAVSKLQDDLRVVRFYTAATTGIYDKETETAVINFQKSQELTPDGIAGPKTLAALAKLISAALNTSGTSSVTSPATSSANPPSSPSKTLESRAPLNPTVTLQLDSRGEDVRTLQMKLAQLGYYTGGITGVFEDKTYEAVVRFQKDRGLNADGLVKANTWEELAAQ